MVMFATGWAIIKPSSEAYVKAHVELDKAWSKAGPDASGFFELETELMAQEHGEQSDLFRELEEWLIENTEYPKNHWFGCQMVGDINNMSGYVNFYNTRNHRTGWIWPFMEFIAKQSKGSYGLVYIHDDEDHGPEYPSPRTPNDNTQSFRAWRILDGQVTEHDDPFFSPFTSVHAFVPY